MNSGGERERVREWKRARTRVLWIGMGQGAGPSKLVGGRRPGPNKLLGGQGQGPGGLIGG